MTRGGRITIAAILAWSLVVAGCGSAGPSPRGAAATPVGGGISTATLTADPAVRYEVSTADGSLRMSASGSGGGGNNRREVLWPAGTPVSTDHLVCGTWRRLDDPSGQQGVALRIAPRRDGTLRAITVTKNTFLGAHWAFNVHVWDTARDPALDQVARIELESAFRRTGLETVALPWRMCARAQGDSVEIKVWPLADAEPAWGDPRFGGRAALPPGWDFAGRSGWYIGHLPAGATAVYDDCVPTCG